MNMLQTDKRSETSPDNGKQGGRPFIDVQGIADKFINQSYRDQQGHITLINYKSRYYSFNGKYYLEVSNAEIENQVTGYIRKNCTDWFRISKSIVNDILLNIRATDLTGINGISKLPFWIDKKESAKNLLICNNGILDIDKAVTHLKEEKELDPSLLQPLTPKLFSTYGIDYNYHPLAACPKWLKYLREVQPDKEVREQLQMMFGLALIPETKFNKAFLLIGEGGTGKSVCLYVLEKLVGPNNCCCVPLSNLANKFSLYPLTVKLLNIVGELPTQSEKASFSAIEGIFKDITDGGNLPIEQKHVDPEKARAIARCIFAGNDLPHFADKTNGVWDRLVIIPFNERFRGTSSENPNLRYELVNEELSGILNWAIGGLAVLLTKHNYFPETKIGEYLKEKHRADCDHERTFLIENYEEKTGFFVESKTLYEHYQKSMIENGNKALGISKFNKNVSRVFKTVSSTRTVLDGEQKTKWQNLSKKTIV